MTDKDLTTEETEGWTIVRLGRPAARNALRTSTWQQLEEALDTVEAGGTAGLILTGGPQWFCSGADLREAGGSIPQPSPGVLWSSTARLRLAQRTIERLRAFPKPTIAAVEGYAIGVGWSLALSCDLIVSSSSAFFAQPAAAAGMVSDGGLVRDLCQAVGYQAAAAILLSSSRLEAADAFSAGMVTRLSQPGGTLADALDLARRVSAVPEPVRFALKSMLAAVRGGTASGFMEHEALAVAFNKLQPGHAEGRARFAAGARFYAAAEQANGD